MATPKRSFRDRFFTPPVARAVTSPLGILLAGAGAAVGIVAGGIPVGIVLGVVAWGGRVLAAVPRDGSPTKIDPFTLNEPWKRSVIDAIQAQARFRDAVKGLDAGPLKDRMQEIGLRIDEGVEQAWRVAKQGANLVAARRRIDDVQARRELGQVQAEGATNDARNRTVEALQAQLDSAKRLDDTISEATDRLRLTNARLDEAVARAAELSVQAGDVGDLAGLGNDVDALVTDLEALRLGLEEVSRPATGTS